MKLLTTGNPKIAKGESLGYLTSILHMAPARLSGYNVCPMASAGCTAACLNIAGRGGMFAGAKTADLTGGEMLEAIRAGSLKNKIQSARIARTKMFFEQREAFFASLVKEIRSAIRLAEKHQLTAVFRLNGTSDLQWEVYPVTVNGVEYSNIFSAFPLVQFYDYTKIAKRFKRDLPKNYHLTFSLSEDNDRIAYEVLELGGNVAVVFRKELPAEYKGRRVVNGDTTDLRFLDPQNVIVGLKAKGKAKKETSGFVR